MTASTTMVSINVQPFRSRKSEIRNPKSEIARRDDFPPARRQVGSAEFIPPARATPRAPPAPAHLDTATRDFPPLPARNEWGEGRGEGHSTLLPEAVRVLPASCRHSDAMRGRTICRQDAGSTLSRRHRRTQPNGCSPPGRGRGWVRSALTRHPRLSSNQRTGIAVSIWFSFHACRPRALTRRHLFRHQSEAPGQGTRPTFACVSV